MMVVEKTNRVCVNYLKIKISNGLIDGYIKGLLIITIIIKKLFHYSFFFDNTKYKMQLYIFMIFVSIFINNNIIYNINVIELAYVNDFCIK